MAPRSTRASIGLVLAVLVVMLLASSASAAERAPALADPPPTIDTWVASLDAPRVVRAGTRYSVTVASVAECWGRSPCVGDYSISAPGTVVGGSCQGYWAEGASGAATCRLKAPRASSDRPVWTTIDAGYSTPAGGAVDSAPVMFVGSDRYVLEGNVVKESGEPAAGERVVIDGPGTTNFFVKTDASGYYNTIFKREGTYKVKVVSSPAAVRLCGDTQPSETKKVCSVLFDENIVHRRADFTTDPLRRQLKVWVEDAGPFVPGDRPNVQAHSTVVFVGNDWADDVPVEVFWGGKLIDTFQPSSEGAFDAYTSLELFTDRTDTDCSQTLRAVQGAYERKVKLSGIPDGTFAHNEATGTWPEAIPQTAPGDAICQNEIPTDWTDVTDGAVIVGKRYKIPGTFKVFADTPDHRLGLSTRADGYNGSVIAHNAGNVCISIPSGGFSILKVGSGKLKSSTGPTCPDATGAFDVSRYRPEDGDWVGLPDPEEDPEMYENDQTFTGKTYFTVLDIAFLEDLRLENSLIFTKGRFEIGGALLCGSEENGCAGGGLVASDDIVVRGATQIHDFYRYTDGSQFKVLAGKNLVIGAGPAS